MNILGEYKYTRKMDENTFVKHNKSDWSVSAWLEIDETSQCQQGELKHTTFH